MGAPRLPDLCSVDRCLADPYLVDPYLVDQGAPAVVSRPPPVRGLSRQARWKRVRWGPLQPPARRPASQTALNRMLALVPPKPKLFDSATLIGRSCAALRHPVDHAVAAGFMQIERRRGHAVAHRQDREHRLHRAGRAEQMPGRRFGGRHRQALGVLAEQPLHRLQLQIVAERRRGAVRVDVLDVARYGCRRCAAPPSWRGTRRHGPRPAR